MTTYVPIPFPSVLYDTVGTPYVAPTPTAVFATVPTLAPVPPPPPKVDPVHLAALTADAVVMITVHPTLGIMIAPAKAPNARK